MCLRVCISAGVRECMCVCQREREGVDVYERGVCVCVKESVFVRERGG